MLLAHDSETKQTTLEALPTIIEYYQGLGYTFEAIDRNSFVCHHIIYSDDDSSSSDNEGSDEDADYEESYEEESEEGDGGATEDEDGDYV
jgi:hypothetical protein